LKAALAVRLMGGDVERVLMCTVALVLAACQRQEPSAPVAGPAAASQVPERDQQALYTFGVSLARQYADLHLTVEELQHIKAGMREQFLKDKRAAGLRLDMQGLNELRTRRAAEHAAVEKQKAQPFLEQAAREEGMVKTESGLLFRSLAEGTGPSPSSTDGARVHFRARFADGTEFDSSYKDGRPHEIQLSEVTRCWKEGVLRMKVGGKAKLVCPSDLTYGDSGLDYTVPGGAATVFELELLELLPKPAEQAPPPTR
jgi:FKBP-type peptidyl-prolyl cis-trans isomerase FkpA